MLSNVILYLGSTAAQVWAAVMVFHIVIVREKFSRSLSELSDVWEKAKEWWPDLMKYLRDPNPGSMKEKLPQFELSLDEINKADTDKTAGLRLLKAITKFKIVTVCGKPTLGRGGHESINADAWQQKFEPLAERAIYLESIKAPVEIAFYVGLTEVIVNLAAIALLTIIYEDEALMKALIKSLCLINLCGFGIFARQVISSLKS